jgi:hypothetical protein
MYEETGITYFVFISVHRTGLRGAEDVRSDAFVRKVQSGMMIGMLGVMCKSNGCLKSMEA